MAIFFMFTDEKNFSYLLSVKPLNAKIVKALSGNLILLDSSWDLIRSSLLKSLV